MKYRLYHASCPDGQEFSVDSAIQAMNRGWTEGKVNAIKTREKQENCIIEYQGVDANRQATEASGSDSIINRKKGGWPKGKKRKT